MHNQMVSDNIAIYSGVKRNIIAMVSFEVILAGWFKNVIKIFSDKTIQEKRFCTLSNLNVISLRATQKQHNRVSLSCFNSFHCFCFFTVKVDRIKIF